MLLSHYIWRSSEAACHVFKVSVAAVLLLSAWDLFGILLLQKGIFWLNCSHSHQAGRMFWAQMLSWMLDFMEMFQENFLDQHFETNRFLYLHMWRLGIIPSNSLNNLGWKKLCLWMDLTALYFLHWPQMPLFSFWMCIFENFCNLCSSSKSPSVFMCS